MEEDYCIDCGRRLSFLIILGVSLAQRSVTYKEGDVCEYCDKDRRRRRTIIIENLKKR